MAKITAKDLKGVKSIMTKDNFGGVMRIDIYQIFTKKIKGKNKKVFKGKYCHIPFKGAKANKMTVFEVPFTQVVKELNGKDVTQRKTYKTYQIK